MKSKGFTIIELLIAITIVTIVAIVAVIVFGFMVPGAIWVWKEALAG